MIGGTMKFHQGEPGNAPAGQRFRNGRSGPLGRSRLKSANTQESPTGYRSRGPSAARQARVLARRAAKLAKRTVAPLTLPADELEFLARSGRRFR
jgi:hypothetical protein